jgi:hypothetical protein
LLAPRLVIDGVFGLDQDFNPPPLKSIESRPDGSKVVRLGRGIDLRLGDHDDPLDCLLDARLAIDPIRFHGLGSVEEACAVVCKSNTCRAWALTNHRPRTVAKVIGVDSVRPRYVLLTMPSLKGAQRNRRESPANRIEAGLKPHVLVERGSVECIRCPGPNRGELLLEP